MCCSNGDGSALRYPQCGSSFWFAFYSTGRGTARVYGDPDLRGYRHGDGVVTQIETSNDRDQECNGANPPASCEGDYERLAKAIGEYNGAADILRSWVVVDDPRTVIRGLSWPEILRHAHYAGLSGGNDGGIGGTGACYSCGYSVNIRTAADRFDMTPRTYIWLGGVHPQEHPQAGQEWCFAYGERVDESRFTPIDAAAS